MKHTEEAFLKQEKGKRHTVDWCCYITVDSATYVEQKDPCAYQGITQKMFQFNDIMIVCYCITAQW
jgi:hypothetical protein